MVESDLVLENKKTLKKHFISQDMLVSCNKTNVSGMNLVSHQNSCFAPLSNWHCVVASTNNQNQSELHYCSYINIIRCTFYHFMYCMYVLMFRNNFMKKYQNVIVI